MKNLQKSLSFLLVFAILLTVFAAAPIQVTAASTNYLVLHQPVDEQGNIIGHIQKENHIEDDWEVTGYEDKTTISLSVDAEDGYEFVGWDVHIRNGDAIEVRQEGYLYSFDIPEGPVPVFV